MAQEEQNGLEEPEDAKLFELLDREETQKPALKINSERIIEDTVEPISPYKLMLEKINAMLTKQQIILKDFDIEKRENARRIESSNKIENDYNHATSNFKRMFNTDTRIKGVFSQAESCVGNSRDLFEKSAMSIMELSKKCEEFFKEITISLETIKDLIPMLESEFATERIKHEEVENTLEELMLLGKCVDCPKLKTGAKRRSETV